VHNYYLPGNQYFVSFPCGENSISFNERHWESNWTTEFTHAAVFSWNSGNYLLSYSEDTGVFVIHSVTKDNIVETARGQWESHWTTFTVTYYGNQVILISSRGDRQDVGLLTGNGYTFLRSRAGFDEFIKQAVGH